MSKLAALPNLTFKSLNILVYLAFLREVLANFDNTKYYLEKYIVNFNDIERVNDEIMEIDKDMIKSGLTLVGAFVVVLFAVFFGWFLMWKLFLRKFRFIRELLSVEEGDQEAASIGNNKKITSNRRKIRRD